MAKCLTCSGKFSCPTCMPLAAFEPAVSNVGQISQPCPEKCAATIHVIDRLTRGGIPHVPITLSGATGGPATDINGFAHYAGLAPNAYAASVDLTTLADRYALPAGTTLPLSKTIAAGGYEFYVIELEPLTTLEVTVARSDRDGLGVKQAKVTLTGANGLNLTETTAGDDGRVLFTKLPVNEVNLALALEGETKNRFHINEAFAEQTRSAADTATRVVALDRRLVENKSKFVVTPMIFLKLLYKDPEGTAHNFPKDLDVSVVFTPGDISKDLKVLDDDGHLRFEAENGKTHFTLKFDSTKLRLLSHTTGQAKAELLADQTEQQMHDLTTAGKQYFALPKTWSLVHAAWTAEAVTVPKDGKIAIPAEGVGTESAPGKLTLLPKLQYVRFQFHDRKYGHPDHAKKQVHIPAVTVKAARQCDDTTGDPVTPIAGSHDALSNWMLDKADNAKGCQVIAWIVTKNDTGDDLPKLNNKMLIEFGWEDGFVRSQGAADRIIERLADTDVLRKPGKDRRDLYDLPKQWRSKCYATRWGVNIKFFDELTEGDIEASLVKATPFAFSLDDIVLTDAAGSPAVQDKDLADGDVALSEHSRFALLHLDPEDKFKVKVHDPRDEAAYHSKSTFAKDGANTWRNVILVQPFNTRVVVFCNGFHDIFDKRTTVADFSAKQMLGARAAQLEDVHVSVKKDFLPTSVTDVSSAYVHMARNYILYYLHYGSCDGSKVYGAVVTHWPSFVFSTDAERPATFSWTELTSPKRPTTGDAADARKYRKEGMANAMKRWNEKDYELEPVGDPQDVLIKFFKLFEAKAVESAPGVFVLVGGKPRVNLGVGPGGTYVDTFGDEQNYGGSVANSGAMYMRKPAFEDEGDWGGDVRKTDYDGVERKRFVFAHELGHAAIGLWDDYITQQLWDVVPGYKAKQRYLGVPYNRDEKSMMNTNRAPRLRMFWGRANWLNDEAAVGKDLNKFLAARSFQLIYTGGAAKLTYRRGTGTSKRSMYEPDFTGAHDLGLNGLGDLHLFSVSQDEFTQTAKGGPYTGMLVLEIRIALKFKTGLAAPAPAWATATAYTRGQCVEFKGDFHLCRQAHTAAAFDTDLGADKWLPITPPDAAVADWAENTALARGDWVKSGANHSVCETDHQSGAFIADNFLRISPSPAVAWSVATPYASGDSVTQGGASYVCTQNHTSAAFGTDTASWSSLAGADVGAWASGLVFTAGQRCSESGDAYLCRVAHTAGSLDADIAAKRLVRSPSKPKKWKNEDKSTWVGDVHNAILAALEGDEGKFRLTTAAGIYANTYLRVFPQWREDDGTAAASTTHVNFSVTKGGTAAFVYPDTASPCTVKVADSSSGKLITRFLLGKGAAMPDSNLLAADLVKLKEWMDLKTGAVFAWVDVA